MARLYHQALICGGHQVDLASELRTLDKNGNVKDQQRIVDAAEAECARLIRHYKDGSAGCYPDMWFTYHHYYKAPDLIGAAVAAALDIPYVASEVSHAPKRARGPWADFYQRSVAITQRMDLVISMTQLDTACLTDLMGGKDKIRFLPPFIDPAPVGIDPADVGQDRKWLITVAMMRPGDKLASYRQLAESLLHLKRLKEWGLIIVGDGAARLDVESAFSELSLRVPVIFTGETDPWPWLKAADLYVWPSVNEAYGMAFLEAQSVGVPVVAAKTRGVPDVVVDGQTGTLVPLNDGIAFAQAVEKFLESPAMMTDMGEAAKTFVEGQRTIAAAAAHLNGWFESL